METKVGQKYKHYKGNSYIILHLANDSNTLKRVVIYQGQYDSEEFGPNPIWVREKTNFEETITRDGKEIRRFEFIE